MARVSVVRDSTADGGSLTGSGWSRTAAAAPGDVDAWLDTVPPGFRLPWTDPRAGPGAAVLPAALSSVDDESAGPVPAEAIPQPVRSATPTPTATASPRP
jgi:hypothetical protein